MKNKIWLGLLCLLLVSLAFVSVPFGNAATEITIQVSASSDDTRVYEAGAAHPPFDSMSALTAKGLTAGSHGITDYYYGSAFRFLNVSLPVGALISTAKLELEARSSKSLAVNTRITGEDVDDSSTFVDIANYNARARTTEFVDWDNIGAWTINTWYDSPDIANVIQEIINRGGWASGNNLTVFWEDHGSVQGANRYRQAKAYDHASGSAPKLVITYTLPRYITFLFNEGGQFRVDNTTITNGTTNIYGNGTILELASLPRNNTWIFSFFEWDSTNSTVNPYNLTVMSNLTVWCYFNEATTYTSAILIGVAILFIPVGAIIYAWRKH